MGGVLARTALLQLSSLRADEAHTDSVLMTLHDNRPYSVTARTDWPAKLLSMLDAVKLGRAQQPLRGTPSGESRLYLLAPVRDSYTVHRLRGSRERRIRRFRPLRER